MARNVRTNFVLEITIVDSRRFSEMRRFPLFLGSGKKYWAARASHEEIRQSTSHSNCITVKP
jgi:hypothetical protein